MCDIKDFMRKEPLKQTFYSLGHLHTFPFFIHFEDTTKNNFNKRYFTPDKQIMRYII